MCYQKIVIGASIKQRHGTLTILILVVCAVVILVTAVLVPLYLTGKLSSSGDALSGARASAACKDQCKRKKGRRRKQCLRKCKKSESQVSTKPPPRPAAEGPAVEGDSDLIADSLFREGAKFLITLGGDLSYATVISWYGQDRYVNVVNAETKSAYEKVFTQNDGSWTSFNYDNTLMTYDVDTRKWEGEAVIITSVSDFPTLCPELDCPGCITDYLIEIDRYLTLVIDGSEYFCIVSTADGDTRSLHITSKSGTFTASVTRADSSWKTLFLDIPDRDTVKLEYTFNYKRWMNAKQGISLSPS